MTAAYNNVVYSITSRESFEYAKSVLFAFKRAFPSSSFCVVGRNAGFEEVRQVKSSEGMELAKEFGCFFMESSSRERSQVGKSFKCFICNSRW